jgi:DNA-binding GntR family transcriptional regulator
MAKKRSPSIAEARVYRELKERIMSGLFKPSSLLIQEDLCRQLRVSRTPIRDALTHLQAEGLVVAMPNKGVFVRELSQKEVHDIYQIRILLETAAAKDAALKASRQELKAVLAEVLKLKQRKNLSFEAVRKVGARLHRLIVVSSANRMMQEILDRMDALIEVTRIPFRESSERLKQINEEHIEIIRALLRGNGEMAAELMETHITLTREAHLKILMGPMYGGPSSGSG